MISYRVLKTNYPLISMGIRGFCNQKIEIPEIKNDYYATLNVDNDAEKNEIKESYLKLARIYHPDVCEGSEKYFTHLTSAYQTLTDDTKRVEYDNKHVYTKDYFTINFFGIKIDLRNAFWAFIFTYGMYRGYRYYDDTYVIKCPLEKRIQTAAVDLENDNPDHLPDNEQINKSDL